MADNKKWISEHKPCDICGEKPGWHTWYKRTDKGHEGEDDVCPRAMYMG